MVLVAVVRSRIVANVVKIGGLATRGISALLIPPYFGQAVANMTAGPKWRGPERFLVKGFSGTRF
jgi:hypothetical protein